MTTINKATELEYCDTCGSMLVIGECRRCNPTTRRIMPKMYKKPTMPKAEIHQMGIDYVVEKLAAHGISVRYSNDNGIDLILDNNKTILIRTMSNDGRIALINGDITTLKSDYLIIVTNIQFTIPNIYIVSIDNAKNMSIAAICKRDNQDEHFIDRLQYVNYKNNYDILR